MRTIKEANPERLTTKMLKNGYRTGRIEENNNGSSHRTGRIEENNNGSSHRTGRIEECVKLKIRRLGKIDEYYEKNNRYGKIEE